MKTSKEIRAAARAALFHSPAGARAMSAMLFLTLVSSAALLLLLVAFRSLGIETLDRFLLQGRYFWLTPKKVLLFSAVATLFAAFVRAVFVGIQCYGWSIAALRGIQQEAQGLTRAAFAGFKVPFGMFALVFGYALRLFLALLPFSLLFGGLAALSRVFRLELRGHSYLTLILLALCLLVGILGFMLILFVVYRYRFIWYLKAEHPEWRANKCFLESARQMNGLKKKAFYLDCSYWKALTLLFVVTIVGALPFVPVLLRALCMNLIVPVLGFFLSVYVEFGHALFYHQAKK